jgi:hypothetical protein
VINAGKRKRTISVRGSEEDNGVYFRCWNCGFICDSTRDRLGDGGGITVKDAPEYWSEYDSTQDGLSITPGIRMHNFMAVTLENGPLDDPITTYRHNKYPVVNSGCPFCGCRNYR